MKKIIVGFMALGLLMGCSAPQEKKEITLSFQNTEFVEYGSQVDTSDFVMKTNGDIPEYQILDTSVIGKQTLDFDVVLDQEKKTFNYTVEVKDTQKPMIELKNKKVEIEYNGKLNIADNIKSVKDPIDGDIAYKKASEVKSEDVGYYTFSHQIKTAKAGSYKVIVKAVDKNKNATESSFEVIVKEEKKTVKQKTQTSQSTSSKQSTPKKENPKQTVPSQNTEPVEPNQKDYSYVLTSTIGKTKASQNAQKIVTVSSSSYSSKKAIVQYFVKENNTWVEKMKVNGQVGKAGIGVGRENSTKTPIGTYHFTHAYGIKANPGSLMPYTQINEHHYWCGDQYYNQFVDDTLQDHSVCSIENDEHLIDYPISYDYFASFNYNAGNTPGKGSAFFLHCIDSRYSSTEGCVAVLKSQMVYLLKNIDTSTVLIIDQVSKIENH